MVERGEHMPVGDKVLVRSFPADPLIRQIYYEDSETVLVWRGTAKPDDLPAPCPKDRIFLYDNELAQQLKDEVERHGYDSPLLSSLWAKAKPYYNMSNILVE
jgi:hypothetical protein